MYFGALEAMQLQLGMADRRQLFGAVSEALKTSEQEVQISEVLTLRLGELVETLARRVRDFEAWKNRLVSDPDIMGGATCFPATRLTVRQVGEALRRGASEDEVLGDYSYLEPADLEHALVFVKAYPRVGRPALRR